MIEQHSLLDYRPFKAVLFGGTGAIGRALRAKLLALDACESLVMVVRKETGLCQHPKVTELVRDDITDVPSEYLDGAHVFCAIGTTIKQAKSEQAFRAVDYDTVLGICQRLKAHAQTVHIVSSVGADANSKHYYLKTKGEMEREAKAMLAERVYFYRPSLLEGALRPDGRPLEFASQILLAPLKCLPFNKAKRYAPIHVRRVAAAMLHQALHLNEQGPVLESEVILKISQQTPLYAD